MNKKRETPGRKRIGLVSLVHYVLKSCWGRAPVASQSVARTDAQTAAKTAAQGPSATSRPMTAEAQWDRLKAVVELSATRAETINAFHNKARQQLDAAEYGMQGLLAELRAVMPDRAAADSRDAGALNHVPPDAAPFAVDARMAA